MRHLINDFYLFGLFINFLELDLDLGISRYIVRYKETSNLSQY